MQNLEHIDISLIDEPEIAMRQRMDPEKLDELTQSISKVGILQPLVLRKKAERYEVIAGNRRLLAAGRARISKVPAVVRDATDSEAIILRVHENHAREDVDPVSEGILFARTIHDFGVPLEHLAFEIGKSRAYVENRLAIAEMPDYMQDALQKREIGIIVALELFDVKDEAWRMRYVSMAKNDGMSVATAHACRQQWEETRQRFQEAGLDTPVTEIPAAPPVVQARCEKCGAIDDVGGMRFVRIHSTECKP